jgi:hypothetical protein
MSKNITSPQVDTKSPLERTSMRSSWTQPQGGAPAFIHEARVVDINLVTWTVDVRTQYDQRFFPNVQVSSPYMHANRGEGFYAMPEVNAKCLVCIPSDGPPPFILAFIMPMETPEDPEGDDGAEKAAETAGTNQGAVFSGGRTRAKPGDMYWRGRDGNFVVLHRGGVLQIGASELAQRIYIPLGNIVTDISQNYEHHNTGGSVNWGLSTSSTDKNPETAFRQTFRLYAGDEKADIRVSAGKVYQPVPEPTGDAGELSANTSLGIGKTVALEVVIAPGGFDAESGTPVSGIAKMTKLKLFFDREGGGFLRAEGSVNVRIKKKLRLVADEGMDIRSKKTIQVAADETVRVSGGKGVQITAASGATVINGGDTPVAAVGSAVNVLVTTPVPVVVMMPGTPPVPTPAVISSGAMFTGFIINGSSTVLVPRPG